MAAATPLAADLQQLAKHHAGTPIFRDVTLQLQAGELLAIVGESGVGKSTLLHCMAGLDPWDQGRVLIAGHDLASMDSDARAHLRRAHIGFVFQAFHVLPHLDVQQNVALPLLLLGQSDPQRVQHMLDAMDLGGLGQRLPHQLSGGQLQRVAMARALVHQPRLVLADEPTGNLDPATAERVMQTLVTQCRQHGSALVLVTHSSTAATKVDRVLRLTPQGLQAPDRPLLPQRP